MKKIAQPRKIRVVLRGGPLCGKRTTVIPWTRTIEFLVCHDCGCFDRASYQPTTRRDDDRRLVYLFTGTMPNLHDMPRHL